MGFFDDTLTLAQETFDVIGKKTEEVVAVQKLKLKAKSAENKINSLYERLGKMCYEQFLNDNESVAFAGELAEKITEKSGELQNLREEICKAKGGKCCEDCKTFNEQTAAFCKKCGKEL